MPFAVNIASWAAGKTRRSCGPRTLSNWPPIWPLGLPGEESRLVAGIAAQGFHHRDYKMSDEQQRQYNQMEGSSCKSKRIIGRGQSEIAKSLRSAGLFDGRVVHELAWQTLGLISYRKCWRKRYRARSALSTGTESCLSSSDSGPTIRPDQRTDEARRGRTKGGFTDDPPARRPPAM
jgi:hypothetical protein